VFLQTPSGKPKGDNPTQAAPAKPKPEEPDSQFLYEARLRRTPLAFHLRGSHCITGTVRSLGRYSVDVHTASGRVLIWKHAIDWLETIAPPTPSDPAAAAAGIDDRTPDSTKLKPLSPPQRLMLAPAATQGNDFTWLAAY
jgi:sRNA-binding regulator protein Hfq